MAVIPKNDDQMTKMCAKLSNNINGINYFYRVSFWGNLQVISIDSLDMDFFEPQLNQ